MLFAIAISSPSGLRIGGPLKVHCTWSIQLDGLQSENAWNSYALSDARRLFPAQEKTHHHSLAVGS
jgi:hypothetical protein